MSRVHCAQGAPSLRQLARCGNRRVRARFPHLDSPSVVLVLANPGIERGDAKGCLRELAGAAAR